jgi:hypothetical protein
MPWLAPIRRAGCARRLRSVIPTTRATRKSLGDNYPGAATFSWQGGGFRGANPCTRAQRLGLRRLDAAFFRDHMLVSGIEGKAASSRRTPRCLRHEQHELSPRLPGRASTRWYCAEPVGSQEPGALEEGNAKPRRWPDHLAAVWAKKPLGAGGLGGASSRHGHHLASRPARQRSGGRLKPQIVIGDVAVTLRRHNAHRWNTGMAGKPAATRFSAASLARHAALKGGATSCNPCDALH